MDFEGEVDHYDWLVVAKAAPLGGETVITLPFTKKEVAKKALRRIEAKIRNTYQETIITRKSKSRFEIEIEKDLDILCGPGVSELVFKVERIEVKSSILTKKENKTTDRKLHR